MEEMVRPTGLQKRKNSYYIRIAVPKDLKKHYPKTEFIKSLKTQEFDEACKRCRQEHVLIEAEFDKLRLQIKKPETVASKDQLSHYSSDQLKALAIEWAIHQDDEHENVLALKTMKKYEWQEALMTLREDAGHAANALHGDFGGAPDYGQREAEKILKAKEISYDKNSDAFKRFERLMKKAIIDVSEKAIIRHQGKAVPSHIDNDLNPAVLASMENDFGVTVGFVIDEFKRKNPFDEGGFNERTYRIIFDVMEEMIGRDQPIKKIDKRAAVEISEFLRTMPKNLRKSYPRSKYSIVEAHKMGVDSGKDAISHTTAKTYIQVFNSVLIFAEDQDFIEKNPASKLQKPKSRREKKRKRRFPFNSQQLNQIFSAPIYTGCLNAERGYNCKGTLIPDDTARFWAPLISLWTGMRMHEILQLEKADIQKIDGYDVIVVTETYQRSEIEHIYQKQVKTGEERTIPVHPELKKIGFLEFIQSVKSAQTDQSVFDDRIFSEVEIYKRDLSHYYSKWFGQFLDQNIDGRIKGKTVFHSFRHNFRTAMSRAKLSIDSICAFGGWTENLGVHNIYRHDIEPEYLYEDMCKIRYHDLDLSHLYLCNRKKV
jgi:integrase